MQHTYSVYIHRDLYNSIVFNIVCNLLSEKLLNLRTYSRPVYRLFILVHNFINCIIQLPDVLILLVLELVGLQL